MKFKVLGAVIIKVSVVQDVTPYNLVDTYVL
jgi:hypothetical protein